MTTTDLDLDTTPHAWLRVGLATTAALIGAGYDPDNLYARVYHDVAWDAPCLMVVVAQPGTTLDGPRDQQFLINCGAVTLPDDEIMALWQAGCAVYNTFDLETRAAFIRHMPWTLVAMLAQLSVRGFH